MITHPKDKLSPKAAQYVRDEFVNAARYIFVWLLGIALMFLAAIAPGWIKE